jgi:hypothetical protein
MNSLLLILFTAFFQVNHSGPKLFDALPNVIHIEASNMGALLTNENVGSKITMNTQETVPLKVELFNYTKWNAEEKTVAYKLLGYPEGTHLIINIAIRNNQTIYRGYIKHMGYADAYTISFTGSELILTKTELEHIVVE